MLKIKEVKLVSKRAVRIVALIAIYVGLGAPGLGVMFGFAAAPAVLLPVTTGSLIALLVYSWSDIADEFKKTRSIHSRWLKMASSKIAKLTSDIAALSSQISDLKAHIDAMGGRNASPSPSDPLDTHQTTWREKEAEKKLKNAPGRPAAEDGPAGSN
ncbi:hypothetical protein [Zavarzinella formosa]|uniref:hypothetical protein n=1 Tax=Zavarzinella formosa TaxID=360055 RepID=UPI0002F8CCD0|nr:hypothetical protein [Zavarzinella formosa]